MSADFFTGSILVNGVSAKSPYAYFDGYANTVPPFTVQYGSGYRYIDYYAESSGEPDIKLFNMDSSLCIYGPTGYHEPWASARQLEDGQPHRCITLSNGNYISTVRYAGWAPHMLGLKFFDSNDNELYSASFGSIQPGNWGYNYIGLYYDGSHIIPALCFILPHNSNKEFIAGVLIGNSYGNTFFDVPIVKDWKSWTYLKGNGGRYRANLTKIKESSIGYFSGEVTGSASDMDYISSQVDMIPVVQNMLYNVEQTIAWSGSNCWLTLTVHEVSGHPNKAQLMFKFYARGHSTTTPIFSFASEIGVTGTVPDKHLYLAFVYDDENYEALFCPIRVTNADSYIWGYNASQISETDMLNIWQWLHMSDAGEDDRPDNPYDVGTSDNGGTDGVIQPPDEVNPGQLPTLDATTKGLFTVYLPTETQLGDIASFMWSDDVLDNFKKYFGNFNQNVLALYVLPYAPSNPPTKPFKVGRIESDTITAVGYLNQRFVSIDMGEFTVKPRWGSYLDYAPYTKFEIYLPGIGMQVLDTDDIMSVTDNDGNISITSGSIISLEYHLDLITGVCVAYVKINNDVKYQFPGKLGYTIPLTGEDYGRMITAFATVAAGVAGGIAYGGISAPLKNPAIGHMVGGEVSAAVAGTVNAMKPEVHRSGNLSCEASALSTDTPYLIRTMPNKPELVNQQVFTGFPSYKSGVLSDFDGYTECIDAHVEGISCTEEERKMLIEWLRKGVIL